MQDRCAFTIPNVVAATKMKTDLPYRAIFFDEIGDPLGSRTAMTAEQRRYIVLKQADRVKSLFMPQTIPYSSMADRGIRMLAHSWADGITKNTTKNEVKFKFMTNTWKLNYKTKEPLFRYPTIKHKNKIKKVRALWCGKTPTKYWNIYSKLKMENLERITNKVVGENLTEAVMSDQAILDVVNVEIDKDPEKFIVTQKTRKYIEMGAFLNLLRTNNIAITERRAERIKRMIESERHLGYIMKITQLAPSDRL